MLQTTNHKPGKLKTISKEPYWCVSSSNVPSSQYSLFEK